MLPETAPPSTAAANPPAEALDFSQRAYLDELMDGPCTLEELRECLRDLAQCNQVTLGHRPLLQWLKQFAGDSPGGSPLHIVDVGCGGGDTLRHIERWARRRNMPVWLTGVDLSPLATRVAREFSRGKSSIRWVTGDAFSYDTESNPIDLVISSLFTHHLSDDDLVRFLAWMERVSRRGWLINDLRRSAKSYKLFQWLAKTMRWHPFVQHDGPVSIRRAFRTSDWQKYLTAAGVSLNDVEIADSFPGRLCVSRIQQS
ncbi:MAG TPA: methyltransferase domain-containing protein [Acidobacteriaceae bacterium]|jgi:SAM-dependent methyltransferase